MIWRMCIRRINHFFYNDKRINPFCRFCDLFQYIYLYQTFNFLMECILEMDRNSSWSVLRWDCIWFQSQLVGFSWEFTKTLEYVCIGRFHLILCERQVCNRKWMVIRAYNTIWGGVWRICRIWRAGTIHLRSLFRGCKSNCFRGRNWMAKYTFHGHNWMAKYSFRGRKWICFRWHKWICFRGRNWMTWNWQWRKSDYLAHFEFSQQIDTFLEYPSRM